MSSNLKKALGLALIGAFIAIGMWWRAEKKAESSSDGAFSGDSSDSDEGSETRPNRDISDSVISRMTRRFSRREGGDLAAISGRGAIEGIVVDGASGDRIAGVDVLFRRASGEEAVTSAGDGAFAIELAGGRYEVRAIGDQLLGVPQPDVVVVAGGEPLKVRVQVARLATISGRVVDSSGSGVAGASVHFVGHSPGEKALAKGGLLLDQVPSDSDGSFSIDVLPNKQAMLEARKGYLRRRQAIGEVSPGQEKGGVKIELLSGVNISGVVVNSSRDGVDGAAVTVSAVGNTVRRGQTVITGAGGRFSLEPMEPGELLIEARRAGFGDSAPMRASYAPGAPVELSIQLPDVQALSGRVVDGGGDGVAGVRVRAAHMTSQQKALEAYTDSDGTFSLEGAGSGKHWISAVKGGYGDATLRNVRPPQDDLELRLLGFGSIEGKVTDATGGPVADFVVEIVASANLGGGGMRPIGKSRRVRDEAGTYRLSDLHPGRYKISISSDSRKPVALTLAVPDGGAVRGDAVLK